jgi:hypothetical protein
MPMANKVMPIAKAISQRRICGSMFAGLKRPTTLEDVTGQCAELLLTRGLYVIGSRQIFEVGPRSNQAA